MERESTRRVRRPLVISVALAVGLLIALALVVGRFGQQSPADPSATLPLPAATVPTATPDPGATPSGEPGDVGATRTDPVVERDLPLGDLLVPAAGSYVSADLAPVETADADGVVAAFAGTFTNGRDTVRLAAVERESAEAAAAAGAAPPHGFSAEDLRESGDVGDPAVGTYAYYERGETAALRWTNERLVLDLSGAPTAVRELYLEYPL